MLVKLIICGIATWRVSHMLVLERGPWDVFVRLRELSNIKHDDGYPVSWFGSPLLSCSLCTAVWIGLILYILPIEVSLVFAVAGVSAFLEELYGKS